MRQRSLKIFPQRAINQDFSPENDEKNESDGKERGGRNRLRTELFVNGLSTFLRFMFKASRYDLILSHFLSNSLDDDMCLLRWALYNIFIQEDGLLTETGPLGVVSGILLEELSPLQDDSSA